MVNSSGTQSYLQTSGIRSFSQSQLPNARMRPWYFQAHTRLVHHITFETTCAYQKRIWRPVSLTFEIFDNFNRSPQLGSFNHVSGSSGSAQRSYDTSVHQSQWTSRHCCRSSLCSGGALANKNGPGMCSCLQQLALGTVVCSLQKNCHSAWARNDRNW